jgi:ribonuclease BN (tRNA processing enzyme)
LRHSAAREVAQLARDIGVQRLAPIHLHPRWDQERVRRVCDEMRGIFPGVAVLGECQQLAI